MKDLVLVLFFLFTCSVIMVNAQPRAIGLRIGNGIQVSYQHAFRENQMIDVDAGVIDPFGIEAAATYDWFFSFKSWKHLGNLNWYVGPGIATGYNTYKGTTSTFSRFYVGVALRIGVEYRFWFPLQVSFDFRPALGQGVGNHYKNNSEMYREFQSFGLSARYFF